MDDRRFDHLSRWLGARLSRRHAIALAGGAAATTLAGDDALAARATCRAMGGSCTRNAQCCSALCATGRDVPRSRRNRCICPAGSLVCGNACCPAGSACIGGACVDSCTPATPATACVLSARTVTQSDTCLRIDVKDEPGACFDDSDCSADDFHPEILGDYIGCMVSYTVSDVVNSDFQGYCMTWSSGPDACLPPPPP